MREPSQDTPLYTVTSQLTQKLYAALYFATNGKRLCLAAVTMVVLLLILGTVLGNLPFCLAWAAVALLLFYIAARLSASAGYRTARAMQNAPVQASFYHDSFTLEGPGFTTVVQYTDLYRVIFTKKAICLLLSDRQGVALNRIDCPAGLPDFLRSRAIPKARPRPGTVVFTLVWTVAMAGACLMLVRAWMTPVQPRPAAAPTEPPSTAAPAPQPTATQERSDPAAQSTPESADSPDDAGGGYLADGYRAIYNTYLQKDATAYQFAYNAKGESYLIVSDAAEAIEFLQYDRDSANGSCGLYVLERCPKDANGQWSQQNDCQILNIYAYHYWDGTTAASGKTGWGDAASQEYRALTGE